MLVPADTIVNDELVSYIRGNLKALQRQGCWALHEHFRELKCAVLACDFCTTRPLYGTAALCNMQEVMQLGAAAGSALRLQFQQAWMHSPAAGTAAARSHSNHSSRDDDDNSSSSSKGAAAGAASQHSSSDERSSSKAQATEQFKALQEAIEQATEAMQQGQHAREASSLPDHVARLAMRDPLGMLMASRGVPLGISLKVNPDKLLKQQQAAQSER
jgi:hypothetical protein